MLDLEAIALRHLTEDKMEGKTFHEGHIVIDLFNCAREVERLRHLLKKATGIIPRDVAEATVFSQRGDLWAHKFRHKYADEAACGYRPRGPYQPLREEHLTCPDCIDVIRAIGLASETIERGEHRPGGYPVNNKKFAEKVQEQLRRDDKADQFRSNMSRFATSLRKDSSAQILLDEHQMDNIESGEHRREGAK